MVENNYKSEKIPVVTVYYVNDWKNWLAKNHLTEKKVGVICYKKHTGKPSISHREAMDEAICFGWIDTTIKRLDEDRFVRYFVRRGNGANWSKNTLSYAKKLLATGRMAPAGILKYKRGLQKKPHDHGLAKRPDMPIDLKKALTKKRKSLENFEKLSPSTKHMLYRWILRAKGDETRRHRIDSVIKKF
ncbi:MAG: YdeI/OmpD-associated family protein [archaeon]